MTEAELSSRFDLKDSKKWLKHLQERGYVVLKSVASIEDVETAKGLLWHDIELLTGATRENMDTWEFASSTSEFASTTGLYGDLAQSTGAWFIRGLADIKRAFGMIWGTVDCPEEDLLVSMDAVILWRPWWIKREWLPKTEGLHLDENPFRPPRTWGPHPHLDCVQGMVPLLPVTRETGGLEVVPCSHEGAKKDELRKRYPKWTDKGDFCVLLGSDPMQEGERLLLLAQPGDLILWDSRTVHGGRVGTQTIQNACGCNQLARMTVNVAMTPRMLAGPRSERERREGFLRGKPFTHRPHARTTSGQCPGQFPVEALPRLSGIQRTLLGDIPASPEETFRHYADAFSPSTGATELFSGAAGQRALAISDWAAGTWAGVDAVEQVLFHGLEIAQQDCAPSAAVQFLFELVLAKRLNAADFVNGLERLQTWDIQDLRLDFPRLDEYISRVGKEAATCGFADLLAVDAGLSCSMGFSEDDLIVSCSHNAYVRFLSIIEQFL